MTCDPQQNRVYGWERRNVAPLDRGNIAFEQLQGIVDYIYADLDIQYPPKVQKLPKQTTRVWADATRMVIRFQGTGCPTWVLLHEIAHSMTSNFEGATHHHGPDYMKAYVGLICRYLPGANMLLLLASLKCEKVKIKGESNDHT